MTTKLKIIFEDDQILIVNKLAGLVVNRSATIREKTLQDELSEYFHLGSSLGIGDRAGIVHRLDRETSGLLVVAKTQAAFENLQTQFKQRTVQKEYVALVHGKVKESHGTVESKIGRVGKFGKFGIVDAGRSALTDFRVIDHYQIRGLTPIGVKPLVTRRGPSYWKTHAQDYTLLRLFPKTGRTHQIRVHAKSIGHPIVSDLIYCPRKLLKFDLFWCPRLFLHAASIAFTHPVGGRLVQLKSDLPSDLKNAMLYLNQISNIKYQNGGSSR